MSTVRIEDQFPLSDLPSEIRQEEIFRRSSLSMLGMLAQTSKQYEAETGYLRLLSAALNAAPAYPDTQEDTNALAAIALLKEHPKLLFAKKKLLVTDHVGRKIEASPYQIFLGTGDIWAFKQIQEEILPLIENGEWQAEAQFKEQFPTCPWPLPEKFSEEMLYDKRNKLQIEAIVKQLANVKQCLDADPLNNDKPLDTTQQAVRKLCNLFQASPTEVIRSGLHFPLAIMTKIYETYNELQANWSFFTLEVIKPALDALSTVDGQCCQGGLRELEMEIGPSRRCIPVYQQPLGKPLSLKMANAKKRIAAVVDPHDGNVLFVSSLISGRFDIFNRHAWKEGYVSVGEPNVDGDSLHNFGKLIKDKGVILNSYFSRTKKITTLSQL